MRDDRDESQACQAEVEREVCEALDRVAHGESTLDDARLLAAASGARWKYEPVQRVD